MAADFFRGENIHPDHLADGRMVAGQALGADAADEVGPAVADVRQVYARPLHVRAGEGGSHPGDAKLLHRLMQAEVRFLHRPAQCVLRLRP